MFFFSENGPKVFESPVSFSKSSKRVNTRTYDEKFLKTPIVANSRKEKRNKSDDNGFQSFSLK